MRTITRPSSVHGFLACECSYRHAEEEEEEEGFQRRSSACSE
jgi:hypothetical protein